MVDKDSPLYRLTFTTGYLHALKEVNGALVALTAPGLSMTSADDAVQDFLDRVKALERWMGDTIQEAYAEVKMAAIEVGVDVSDFD